MGDAVFQVTRSTDPRLVDTAHTFCATQGASAISVVPIQAATASTTILTYSVIPPSPQVVIQKSPLLDLVVNLQFTVSQGPEMDVGALADDPGVPLAVWGRDVAVARAYPLGQIVSSYNIQINNAAVQQQNVPLPDLAHVLETPRSRSARGTTSRLPLYASWDDAFGTTQALGSEADMQGDGDVGPGAYDVIYTNDQGAPLYSITGGTGSYTVNGVTVQFVNGMPYTSLANRNNSGNPLTPGKPVPIFIQMRLVDVVMCSPFGFSYLETFRETGMYGVSSLLINATLTQPSAARLLQGCTINGCTLQPNSLAWGPKGGVVSAQIWMTYLSPSIQSTLPLRSVVSLCNINYFTASTGVITQMGAFLDGADLPTQTITFSSVTFSNVPDVFLISVRPDPAYMMPSEADWCCTFPDGAMQQFQFANQSGLFAGWNSAALTMMSKDNGSKASVQQYGGLAGSGYFMNGGLRTIAGGSILVIRPGKDFPLPTGVSVGSTGQCQLNFQLKFNAPGAWGTGRKYICTVTALSSGYFVTENGVSRPLLVGLDEATVLGAPDAPDRYITQKLVGGGWFSTLSSFAKNALANKDQILQAAHGLYHGVKNRDLGAIAQHGMGAFQAGRAVLGHGGAMGGGAMAGAGMKRARYGESLAGRLQD